MICLIPPSFKNYKIYVWRRERSICTFRHFYSFNSWHETTQNIDYKCMSLELDQCNLSNKINLFSVFTKLFLMTNVVFLTKCMMNRSKWWFCTLILLHVPLNLFLSSENVWLCNFYLFIFFLCLLTFPLLANNYYSIFNIENFSGWDISNHLWLYFKWVYI